MSHFSEFGYKKCGANGQWEGQYPDDVSFGEKGWTNYTECYTQRALEIYKKLFGGASSQRMKEIANNAKLMEMIGLCLSLISLAISLFIFFYFR